jgi:hypothetical protein
VGLAPSSVWLRMCVRREIGCHACARTLRAFLSRLPSLGCWALLGNADEQRTAVIRGFVPVGRFDRASLYDESLPPGLILRTGEDDAGEHAGQGR